MPETPEERQDRIKQFHDGLMQYQSQGTLEGLPDDFETFNTAFNNPEYRKDLHDWLLMKQHEGAVNDIPGDYREFSNFFDPMPEVDRLDLEAIFSAPYAGEKFEVTDPRSEKSTALREYSGQRHPEQETSLTPEGGFTPDTVQSRIQRIAEGDISALENLNSIQTKQLAEAAGWKVDEFEQVIEEFKSPLNFVDDRTYMRTTSHVDEYERHQELVRAQGILERNLRNPDDWTYLEKLRNNVNDRFIGASQGVAANMVAMREMLTNDVDAQRNLQQTRKRLEQSIQSYYDTTDAVHFTDIGSKDGYVPDFVRWAAGTQAELIPIVGSIMAGGLILGGGAKVAGAGALATAAGSYMGSFLSGYVMYAGDIFGTLTNEDVSRDVAKRTALRYAVPASAVSIIVPGTAGAILLGAMGKNYMKQGVKQILAMAGIATVTEGTAEAVAESFVIMGEQEALGVAIPREEKINRVLNAMAAGGLMGFSIGAVTGAGRPRVTVEEYVSEFSDHAGAMTGQNPELMRIRDEVGFEYNPDAPPAEQKKQLINEQSKLEKQKKEAESRLENFESEEAMQETLSLVNDYKIALDAIQDQIGRIDSGIINNVATNLVNRPLIRQFLLESLINLENQDVQLTEPQQQMKQFLINQEGVTSNKAMRQMNETTDTILVEVMKRTDQHNSERLDRLMQLSNENQTTFEEQVEIAAIMFNKPRVYQAWLNSEEVTTGDTEGGEATPTGEGEVTPTTPGRRPDMVFVDENQNVQNVNELIDAAESPQDVIDQFPVLGTLHEQIIDAATVEEAQMILSNAGLQFSITDSAVNRYLSDLISGQTNQNIVEWLTSFEGDQTGLVVSLAPEDRIDINREGDEGWRSMYDIEGEELQTLSAEIEDIVDNSALRGRETDQIIEDLEAAGYLIHPNNPPFRRWIESYTQEGQGGMPFIEFLEARRSELFEGEGETIEGTESETTIYTDVETTPEHIKPILSAAVRLLPGQDVQLTEEKFTESTKYRLRSKDAEDNYTLVVNFSETDTAVTLHTLFADGSGASIAKKVIDYAMENGKIFESDSVVNRKLVDATKILQRRGYEIDLSDNVRYYETTTNVIANIFGKKYPEGTVHRFATTEKSGPVFRILSAPERISTEIQAQRIVDKLYRDEQLTAEETRFAENNADLIQAEWEKIMANMNPDAEFIVDDNQAIVSDLTEAGTIGDVLGLQVEYGEYSGVLTTDAEGNFVVETEDGTTVEVANSGKNPAVPIAGLGVKRALSTFRNFRHSTGDTFVMEVTDPATGEVTSEPFNFVELNTNDAGEIVGVTMEGADGQQRVFRNPANIEQVAWSLLHRNENADQTLIDAIPEPEPSPEGTTPTESLDVTETMSLDDNDARINIVFDRFDNNQALTDAEQQNALEWINERLQDILDRNPTNVTELLEQLTQFEREVITNDPRQRPQSRDEQQPITPTEDELSPDATQGEDKTTSIVDLEGEAEPTAVTKSQQRPPYHLNQSEYLETVQDQLDALAENNPEAANRAERRLIEQHKKYVADAIQEGHAIPEKVLIDYPDLNANMLPDNKSTAPVEVIPKRPAGPMTREVLRQQLDKSVESGRLTADQAEALIGLVDVRAHLWAKQNRRPEGDYYKVRFDEATGRDIDSSVEEVIGSYLGVYDSISEVYEAGMANLNAQQSAPESVEITGSRRIMTYRSLRNLPGRDVTGLQDLGFGEYARQVRSYRPVDLHKLHSQGVKIQTHADAAYMFTELENSANENVYFVLIDRNDTPTVIHHSVGNQTAASVDITAVRSLIKDFKPKRVYMVHNHPSGTLYASEGDISVMRRLRTTIPQGIDSYGIIINRDSGYFSVINETTRFVEKRTKMLSEGNQEISLGLPSVQARQEQIRNQTAVPINVMSYDRLKILKNPMTGDKVHGIRSVAELIGSKQFTLGNKDTVMFMDDTGSVVGVVHLNNTVYIDQTDSINPDAIEEIGLLHSRFNRANPLIISNRDNRLLPEDIIGRIDEAIEEHSLHEMYLVDFVSVLPAMNSRARQFGDAVYQDVGVYGHRGQAGRRTEGAFVGVESEQQQFYFNEEEALYNIVSNTNDPNNLHQAVKDLSRIFLKDLRGNDLIILEKWAGADNGSWNQQSYAKLEQGFTEYLAEGKSPSEALGRVFGQFKEWLSGIYNHFKGQDALVLTDEVRAVFDTLFEASIEELRNSPVPQAQRGWEIEVDFNPEGTERHKGFYGVIELDDGQSSHHPDGHINSRHPFSRVQPRDRSAAPAVQKVFHMGQHLNPAHIVGNYGTAFFFSPVTNLRGEVIQGHGRFNALLIAASQYPGRYNDYKNHIFNHAEEYGFDRSYLEGFRRPAIVRMLDVSDTEAVRLGNIQQKAELEMPRAEQALATMRQLATEQKQHIARLINNSQAETFRAMLDDIGMEIIDIVMDSRGEFIDSNGNITVDGKNFVEDIFKALTFDSEVNTEALQIFNKIPHALRAGIEKSYGTILEFTDTAADLRPSLQKAIEIVHRVNQSQDWVDVDDMFNTAGMFENYSELYTPAERTLATALFETQNPNSPLMKQLGTTGTQTGVQRLFRRYKDNIYGREDLFNPIEGTGIEGAPEAFQKAFDQRDESARYPDRPESPEFGVEDPTGDVGTDAEPIIPETVTESDVNSKATRKEQLLFAGLLPRIVNAIKAKGPKKKTLTSRQDITNHVIEKLNVSVGVGRSLSLRNAFGFYRWKPMGSAIRNRVANNISTLAHETGHYLHDVLFDMKTPSQYNAELTRLGLRTSRENYSDQQKIMEGQAEFFRILVHNPEMAKKYAPTYYEAFQERLNDDPYIRSGVNELIQMIEQYTTQSLVDQFRSQIARDNHLPTKTGPQNETTLQYIERSVFNAITPFRNLRKDLLTANNEIDMESFSTDAYHLAQLAAGVPGQMKTWMRDGVRNTAGELISHSFESIFTENGITTTQQRESFEEFLLAKRVLELYDQADAGQRRLLDTPEAHGGPLGITRAQAEAVISEFGSAEFETASKKLYEWTDATLEWAVDRSYLTRQELESMKRLNRNYVPMHRVMDHLQNRRDGKKSAMIDQPSLWQRIMGSGRPILPPIQTLLRNTQRMLYMAEKNYAAIQLFEDIGNSERGGLWADRVSRQVRPTKGQLKEIKNALKESGLTEEILQVMNLDQTFELWRPIEHDPSKREVVYRKDGESYIWQIHNDALYDALTGGPPPLIKASLRLLSLSKRIFRTGVVISLDFIAGVTQSDQMAAHINSTYGYAALHLNPFKKDFGSSDFLKGMASILTHSEEYQLWLHSKAGISGIVDVQSDQVGRALKRLGESPAERIIRNIIFPARWIEGMETFSAVFENSTRVGEFRRGIGKEGRSEEGLTRAAVASRNLTDYALMGNSAVVRFIAANKAFFNAGLQGPNASFAAIRRAPVKFMTRGLLSMTMMSLALDRLMDENEDYKERELERQLYWLIPKGDPRTTTEFMRVRKPWQFGAFFGTVIPNALQQAAGYEDIDLLEYLIPTGKDAAGIVASMIPTAMLPLAEVTLGDGQGYNFFFQTPIDPYFDKDLEPYLRYDHRTKELEKKLGRTLNASPRKIRHLIRGYAGMMGTNISDLSSEFMLSQLQREEDPAPPDQDILNQIPGARVFMTTDLTAGRSKSMQDFYRLYDEARVAKNSVKNEEPRYQSQYYIDNMELIQAYPQLQSFQTKISNERDKAASVYIHPYMTPEQKRDALSDINQRMIMLSRQALQSVNYKSQPRLGRPQIPQR